MPFSNYRDNFDPETLAILEAAVVRASPLWVISGHTDKSAPCPLYP